MPVIIDTNLLGHKINTYYILSADKLILAFLAVTYCRLTAYETYWPLISLSHFHASFPIHEDDFPSV